jgi:Uma2 family endonuclease
MAVAAEQLAPPLTYEAYLAEGEVMKRYDILDGLRIYMTNPTRRHQRFLRAIARRLEDFETQYGRGLCLVAPQDVLIRRSPLRTRQPDVLFISHEQLAKCAPETDQQPLLAAPELVVEILSPSETARTRAEKIRDYCSVGVRECWVVQPEARTIEVLRLSTSGAESVVVAGTGDDIRSVTWPELSLAVAQVFGE